MHGVRTMMKLGRGAHAGTFVRMSSSSARSSSSWMAQTAFPRRPPRLERSDAEVRGFRSSSMMLKEDYYKTLGVSRGADEKDIKTEYRKLAKKYHPDVNKDKGAAEKFAEISEAYEILNDKEKRSAYDSFGHAGVGNGAPGGGPGGFGGGNPFGGFGGFHQAGGQNMSQEDLFNIFNQAFGGQGRQRGPRKGSDVQMAMGLDFLEAVNGTTMDIRTEYVDVDSSGTRRRKTRNVNVNIPAGVDTGVVLRVSAKGNTGDAGMPPGDLLLHLDVRDDPYFQRNNYDVHVEVPISVSQAILGDTIDVLTLDGMVEMKVPAGTQPDAQLAMKGKGIKAVNSSRRGTQIVHLKLETPRQLTARQKELMEEFREEEKAATESAKVKRSQGFVDAAWDRLRSFMGTDTKEDGKKKDKTSKKKSQKN